MTTINLKDFYYWYLTDVLVEVPDEVAEELIASKRREAAHAERVRYNKAYYSLDCDDGIEYSACLHELPPDCPRGGCGQERRSLLREMRN